MKRVKADLAARCFYLGIRPIIISDLGLACVDFWEMIGFCSCLAVPKDKKRNAKLSEKPLMVHKETKTAKALTQQGLSPF